VAISAFAIIAMTYTGGGWFGAVAAWFTGSSTHLLGHHLSPHFFTFCWVGLALAVAITAPLLALYKEKAAPKAVEPMWYTPEPGQGAINLDWIQKVQTIRNKRRQLDSPPTT
jgi:hypothetical protein